MTLPNIATISEMEQQDAARVLLAALALQPQRLLSLNRAVTWIQRESGDDFPRDQARLFALQLVLAEGWSWLERAGLIVRAPDQELGSGFYVLTRRGAGLRRDFDLSAFTESEFLPFGLLPATPEAKVRPMFLRGDYDTAVFQAFKEVEVAVRSACGAGNNVLGVNLMRQAFHPDNGPLADPNMVWAEREALMHLFSGAIGYGKNPGSHRHVGLARSSAARFIATAGELLSIVEDHAARKAAGWPT